VPSRALAPGEYFPTYEATRDARAAPRHNHLTVGVEDLNTNCIGERVRVVIDLNGPCKPLRPLLSLTTGTGWDNVTGMGTPNGLAFIRAVAE
jgi:hypothetical protein